jgi:hypothetical protein
MGISLNITSEAWGVDDKSWLKHQLGFDTARPCTLDLSLFTTDEQIDGAIPSGIAVAKITASGLYGPYDPDGADGRQTASGLLLNGVRMTRSADEEGTLTVAAAQFVWQGIVKTAKLPDLPGGDEGVLDANGQADLAQIRFE